MKLDIHNLEIAVARELSLQALLFKNTIDQNIVKKRRVFVRNRIHIRFLPKKKYKSEMIEYYSHNFSNAVYSH